MLRLLAASPFSQIARRSEASRSLAAISLFPVFADCLDRATFHRLATLCFFVVVIRLFENVRVTFIVRSGEVIRRSFTTKIAIDALAIDIELSLYVFFVLIFAVGHQSVSRVVDAACIAPTAPPCNHFLLSVVDRITYGVLKSTRLSVLARAFHWPTPHHLSYYAPARPMSDSPDKPPQVTSRHRPRLQELSKETTEDDLWNLDGSPPAESPVGDEPAFADPVHPSAKPGADPERVVPAVEESAPPLVQPRGPALENRAETPKAKRQPGNSLKASGPPAPEAEAKPPVAVEDLPVAEPTQPEAHGPVRAGREWIGLAVLAVILLGVAIWWSLSLFQNVTTTRLGANQVDLPVKGMLAVVQDVETYWRKPILVGDKQDVVRQGIEMIPAMKVTLKEGDSGVLRAFFIDENGNSVGDSKTYRFADGRFLDSKSSTIEFTATDGFASEADYNGYRMGAQRWWIEVREAPSERTSGSDFDLLFKTPISPQNHPREL